MEQQLNLAIKISVDNWNAMLGRTSKVISEIADEDMQNEVSAGRNTGIYLLGHLVAVHDRMYELLGLGERKYQHLDDAFLTTPDKSGKTMPAVAELRSQWDEVNNRLGAAFSAMQPTDWLNKHNAVSAEEFATQPHRNRLNVLASRTTHLAEHYGQLLFLKKKAS